VSKTMCGEEEVCPGENVVIAIPVRETLKGGETSICDGGSRQGCCCSHLPAIKSCRGKRRVSRGRRTDTTSDDGRL